MSKTTLLNYSKIFLEDKCKMGAIEIFGRQEAVLSGL